MKGCATVTVPTPGAGGWKLNGSARISGDGLQLTQASASQRGSAVWPVPVLTDGLKASFTTVIGGGTGADGLRFSLLDPARTTQSALGGVGGGLGYAGLPGVAVAFDTFRNPGDPSADFIGIATGGSGWTYHGSAALSGTELVLTPAQTYLKGSAIQATAVPSARLRARFTATLSGGTGADGLALLLLDATRTTPTALGGGGGGARVIDVAVTLPRNVLVGFSGTTGGLTDRHVVAGVRVGY
ncbi:lectin-like domain-containing protein [Streptomyces tanashiensis]|uniref:Uncharacterized protein n=1 Tax=Streptomyces tanashiensis TaxID=67367 RepID=A0ABY6R9T2_9ACTN|nr:hypothetical protein [Streptomyces tanashiensis]UZX25689.1 hypothetical protein LDH80_35560 [Streptomyces tanashiensis]